VKFWFPPEKNNISPLLMGYIGSEVYPATHSIGTSDAVSEINPLNAELNPFFHVELTIYFTLAGNGLMRPECEAR
jgi:hypothetical protein